MGGGWNSVLFFYIDCGLYSRLFPSALVSQPQTLWHVSNESPCRHSSLHPCAPHTFFWEFFTSGISLLLHMSRGGSSSGKSRRGDVLGGAEVLLRLHAEKVAGADGWRHQSHLSRASLLITELLSIFLLCKTNHASERPLIGLWCLISALITGSADRKGD